MVKASAEKEVRVALITILLIAALLRLYHFTYQPLWSDEEDILLFAKQPTAILISNLVRPGWNGPLYHLILHFWFGLTGVSAAALRYLSVLAGVVSVALAWTLGKRWLPSTSTLILCMLVATSPYLVWHAQDGKMYSLLFVFSLATLLALDEAIRSKDGWKYGLAFAVLAYLGWYIHILSVVFIPVYLIIWRARGRNIGVRQHVLLMMVLAFLGVPLISWVIPIWISDFTTGHPYVGLIELVRTQLFVFAAGYPSSLNWLGGLVFLFLFTNGALGIARPDSYDFAMIAHCALPTLTIYLISLGMPIYADRYLIPTAFSFYGICTLGHDRLKDQCPYLARVLIALVLLANLSTIAVQANTVHRSGV